MMSKASALATCSLHEHDVVIRFQRDGRLLWGAGRSSCCMVSLTISPHARGSTNDQSGRTISRPIRHVRCEFVDLHLEMVIHRHHMIEITDLEPLPSVVRRPDAILRGGLEGHRVWLSAPMSSSKAKNLTLEHFHLLTLRLLAPAARMTAGGQAFFDPSCTLQG